jgi:REP element-mobilizing transposase RayT
MARPLRIQFPGALYHVTSRGNARQPVYRDDRDRRSFLGLLGEAVERFGWQCHAYCLMENHYHLVIQTPEPNLSRGMRHLNGVYSQRFNHRHERVGHLFQGRFHAVLVEREAHLFELARYVVLNPVRAGLVPDPTDYPWSSLRATLGLTRAPSWLQVEPLLRHFHSTTRYREFVNEGLQLRRPLEDPRPLLGSPGFSRAVRRRVESPRPSKEVARRERVAYEPSLSRLFPPHVRRERSLRDERIREVSRSTAYALVDIARHLGLHKSTVSRIASTDRPT